MTATLTWQPGVEAALDRAVQAEPIPGLVVAVAAGDGPTEYLVHGADAAGRPLTVDSLFPVASVTKLLTGLGVLRLVDAGQVALDDPLSRYAPEAAAAQPGVTLRRLLTHTSGLTGLSRDLAPYGPDYSWDRLRQAALRTPLTRPPGSRVVYAGTNPILLSTVMERVTGQPFHVYLRDEVLTPLAIDGYLGFEPPRAPARVGGLPANEFTGTALEYFNSPFWRSIPQPGGNLVISTGGMIELVRAYRSQPGGFLSPALAAEATSDQTGGLGGGVTDYFDVDPCPWGLGPMVGTAYPWVTPAASARSYGHGGFTAALAWRDPAADVAWALCGAAVAMDGRTGTVSAQYGMGIWCERLYPAIGAAILAAAR